MPTNKTEQDASGAGACRLDRPVRRPRVQTLVRETHEFQGRYKGFDLDLMRDGAHSRWYIRVRDPRGCYAYDGWWADSYGKSLDDAIAEALKGACLWTPNVRGNAHLTAAQEMEDGRE